MSYPLHRPRRLRLTKPIRDLVAETIVSPDHLILPVFVKEGGNPEEIPAMPGQYRWPVRDELVKFVSQALGLGVKSILLFGYISDELKDEKASYSYNPNGVVQKAVKLLRREFGSELIIFTDVCICNYTTHGHCGIPS
ncbi:MAG TPA: porphobilinogen synthase, partial [Pyrodictiaceae archaeon]|nr:porphobilinogen synthase [Pyrodictiaceae archaeon]